MKLGDVIETKKPHPCGEAKWEIVRTGADWKIKCLGCGRFVILSPDELQKRTRRVVRPAEDS